MDYPRKVAIIKKINKLIKLYIETCDMERYIRKHAMKDAYSLTYNLCLLDEEVAFENSSVFHGLKDELIDTNGIKTKDYYEHMDKWLDANHRIYVTAKKYSYDLILNEMYKIKIQDFTELNNMYKIVNRLNKKLK